MKKVLIISYFFPPNTTIVSSLRQYSWYLEMLKQGIEVTIITRHWDTKPIKGVEGLLKEDLRHTNIKYESGGTIYFVPYKKNPFIKVYDRIENYSFLKPVSLFMKLILGMFGVFTNEADVNYAFYKTSMSLIKKTSYDFVISSAMPLSALKLLYNIHQSTGVSVVVDFRDHWNNHLLSSNYKFKLRAKIFFVIQEYYIKKWLKVMKAVISVNTSILSSLNALYPVNGEVIFNGYERELFKNISTKAKDSKKFRIMILGALYPTQNLQFMINGFNAFLKNYTKEDIEILFIGLGYFKDVAEVIEKGLPKDYIKVTERIERLEAVEMLVNSQVLYYIGWEGFKGMYSGKIFEYLGARKNILIAPSDGDVLEELIHETNAGKVVNSVKEMERVLCEWFEEWKSNGKVSYYGIEEKIEIYTREYQANRMIDFLKNLRDDEK